MCPTGRSHLPLYNLLLILLLLLPLTTLGQDHLEPAPACLTIANGTPVKLRLDQTISSTHAHLGDRLKFVVASDVTVDGFTVIPAGTEALGTVVGVKRRRWLGLGGHVIFKVDSVALANGERVALNARTEVKGRSHLRLIATEMIGVSLIFWPAAPAFLISRGSDSFALRGTELIAHVEGDIPVSTANLTGAPNNGAELRDLLTLVPPRVLNGEGVEGDMVNLFFVAQPQDLQQAFQQGGWTKVDQSKLAIAWHLLRHVTHDTKLPMARLYLFGRVQDYSYALPDPTAIVTRRHHLRIWKTDYAFDGIPVWAAAATHDIAIQLWTKRHLLTHRIDPDVDAERDFVSHSLATTRFVSHQEYVTAAVPVFEAQTASGELYYSDSRILLLDLHEPVPGDSPVLTKASVVSVSEAQPSL